MTPTRRRYELFTSFPVQFIFSVIFLEISSLAFQPRLTDEHLISFSIPLGLFLAASTWRRVKLSDKEIGLGDADERWELRRSVVSGVLPENPRILYVLPDYLDHTEHQHKKNRIALPLIIITFIIVLAIRAVTDTNIVAGLMAAGFTVLLVAERKRAKRDIANIHMFRKQMNLSAPPAADFKSR